MLCMLCKSMSDVWSCMRENHIEVLEAGSFSAILCLIVSQQILAISTLKEACTWDVSILPLLYCAVYLNIITRGSGHPLSRASSLILHNENVHMEPICGTCISPLVRHQPHTSCAWLCGRWGRSLGSAQAASDPAPAVWRPWRPHSPHLLEEAAAGLASGHTERETVR